MMFVSWLTVFSIFQETLQESDFVLTTMGPGLDGLFATVATTPTHHEMCINGTDILEILRLDEVGKYNKHRMPKPSGNDVFEEVWIQVRSYYLNCKAIFLSSLQNEPIFLLGIFLLEN